jgi:5'-methylthioadenosine phosphorylase
MVTDYDVWHEQDGPVTVEAVLANLQAMTEAVQTIVTTLAGEPLPECTAGCGNALANAIATAPAAIGASTRERLAPIAGRYLGSGNAG